MNCYDCRYRGTLPGMVHSCCLHPDLEGITDDPIANMFAMFASTGRVGPVMIANRLNVKGKAHGIRNGWFNWPWDFDPVWLENCDGYEEKEKC